MAKAAKLKFSKSGVAVQGTLACSGAATLASTLGVTGATTLASDVNFSGASGSSIAIKTKTATISGLSGASGTATDFIPAGCIVLSLTARVTTLITAATGVTWDIGDETDGDKWGTGLAFAAGTTVGPADWVAGTPTVYAAANDVVVIPDAGTFTAGAIRLVLHYIDVTEPTS